MGRNWLNQCYVSIPLKTSEKHPVFLCFERLQKWDNGLEWVKYISEDPLKTEKAINNCSKNMFFKLTKLHFILEKTYAGESRYSIAEG